MWEGGMYRQMGCGEVVCGQVGCGQVGCGKVRCVWAGGVWEGGMWTGGVWHRFNTRRGPIGNASREPIGLVIRQAGAGVLSHVLLSHLPET